MGGPVWSGGGFFGVCRFLPPTPVPAFVRGFWRLPRLGVTVWWVGVSGTPVDEFRGGSESDTPLFGRKSVPEKGD